MFWERVKQIFWSIVVLAIFGAVAGVWFTLKGANVPVVTPLVQKAERVMSGEEVEEDLDIGVVESHPSLATIRGYENALEGFRVKDSIYLKAVDKNKNDDLVKHLAPFFSGRANKARQALATARKESGYPRGYPVYYNIFIDVVEPEVAEDGRIIPATAKAVVGGALPKTKAFPLPEKTIRFSIGEVFGEKMSYRNTMAAVKDHYIGGMGPDGNVDPGVHNYFLELVMNTFKTIPNAFVVEIYHDYVNEAEETQVQKMRFFPYKSEAQFDVREGLSMMERTEFARMSGVGLERLEKAIREHSAKHPHLEQVRVTYKPEGDFLSVGEPFKTVSHEIDTSLSGLNIEFEISGGVAVYTEGLIGLKKKIMDDNGLRTVTRDPKGNVHVSYKGFKIPRDLVRVERYRKPGRTGPDKIVSYRHKVEALPFSGEQMQSEDDLLQLVDTLSDRGVLKSHDHYLMGCVQEKSKIFSMFDEYKKDRKSLGGDAFPCVAHYNNLESKLQGFEYIGEVISDTGTGLEKIGEGRYRITNLEMAMKAQEEIAEYVKTLGGELEMFPLETFKKAIKELVSEGELNPKFFENENFSNGFYVILYPKKYETGYRVYIDLDNQELG